LIEYVCRAKISGVPAHEDPERCRLAESAAEQGTAFTEVQGQYWQWCPRCGHELHNEKCKLRCPRCHYFMSCSDFD
jgi:Zn finger protein HypA/HybF involved in hydrogenase expression